MSIIQCYCCTNKHKPFLNGSLKDFVSSSTHGLCKKCQSIRVRGKIYEHYPVNKNGSYRKKIRRVVVRKKRRDHPVTKEEAAAYSRGYRQGIAWARIHAKVVIKS